MIEIDGLFNHANQPLAPLCGLHFNFNLSKILTTGKTLRIMNDTAINSRLEKLEERSAFQEHALDELSNALTDQWKLIEALRRDVQRLRDEIKSVEDNALQGGGREPPPPHY